MEREIPRDGDVLVSNPTATVEYQVGIVPRPPHLTCENHDVAVAKGRQLGEQLEVDVWLTEDKAHFLRIGTFRR